MNYRIDIWMVFTKFRVNYIIFSNFFTMELDLSVPFVVIDVGGGSTELSVFENGEKTTDQRGITTIESRSFSITIKDPLSVIPECFSNEYIEKYVDEFLNGTKQVDLGFVGSCMVHKGDMQILAQMLKNIEAQHGKVEFKAPLVVAPPTYNIVDEYKIPIVFFHFDWCDIQVPKVIAERAIFLLKGYIRVGIGDSRFYFFSVSNNSFIEQ